MSEDKTFTKAELDEAIATAKEAQDAKNAELLGEVKKLKSDLRKTQDIKPEDLAALEVDNEKLRAELATANKTAKDATTAAEKATKALEAEQGVTHRLIAENGLVAELTKAGVTDPAYLDATKAMLLGQVKVVAEGEDRKALYGDKPLADAIKEWAGTDIGKRFVAAPNNAGGGAPGGKGGEGGAKIVTRAVFDGMSQPERSNFAKEGGKVVDQAA
jgi:hypothetical protein